MGVSMNLIKVMVSWVYIYVFTKLYILNICNLWYFYYTSMKPFIYIYNPIQGKVV